MPSDAARVCARIRAGIPIRPRGSSVDVRITIGPMDPVVRRTVDREDEEQSLAIYNEVWSQSAITFDEVESFKSRMLAHQEGLVVLDGQTVGSSFVGPDGHGWRLSSLQATAETRRMVGPRSACGSRP